MLDQIRGRSYEEALMLLEYMPFRACEPVLKTLVSVRHCHREQHHPTLAVACRESTGGKVVLGV